MTDLVSVESLNTRKHVSLEAKRTNDAVGLVGQKVDRLVALEGAQIDERARACFLESLKYPGFNQRRSQIDDAYGDTLKWIFVGDNDERSNNDSSSDIYDNSDEYDDFDEDYDSDEDHDSSSNQSGEADEEELSDQGHHSDHSNGPDRQYRPRDSFSTRASHSAGEASSSTVSDWEVSDSEEGEEEEENGDYEIFWGTKWDSFSNWLRSTDAIYWISGKPGSGKTTVVKYILANESTKKYLDIWCPGCTIVSHYFWLPGSPMQRNMEGLLCSLLYQLLEKNSIALTEVMSSVSGSKSSHTDWSHAELHSSVVKALDFYQNGVCLFLDGIDEIKPEDGTKAGIPEFLDWAIELSQRSKIKLCLASRPDPHILETRLSQYPRLRLQDLNHQDLMTYAEGRVKTPEKDISAQSERLIQSLAYKAEGVFLWLILAIKSVNEGFRNDDSFETLQERINCLPQGLDSLYKDMWARAGEDKPAEYRQTAALYFKLLLASNVLITFSNAFDVMLATTNLADRVLHAIADPSKLVREDDILQQYRKVEKKLNIYCVGLIHTVSDPLPRTKYYMRSVSDRSWYGHVYDRIFEVAVMTKLEFVHRTARDFLTDTKSGREILEFDASSELSIECRLLHARLAKIALFTSWDDTAETWTDNLRRLFERWRHIGRELSQNWDRLASVCEQLAESGRLLGGDKNFKYLCNGTWFLIIASRHVGDDNRLAISTRIKNRSLSESEKSFFLVASMHVGTKDIKSLFRTCREVLRAGADPNWQVWTGWGDFPNVQSGPRGVVETPWQWLLLFSVEHLLRRTQLFPWNPTLTTTDLTSLAEVSLLFISEGAGLNDPVNIAFQLDKLGFTEYQYTLGYVDSKLTYEHAIITSVPAYMIVKLLAKCLRRFCSTSDTEIFPRVCAGLENACESHSSSGTCRVIGKSKGETEELEEPGEFSWWETTEDVQTQLGRKVMECLEGLLLSTTPAIEGADISEAREVEAEPVFQCVWNQMFEHIWDHESWTLRSREIGMSSVFERLVELGVMMSLDGVVEFHSKEEWVRKHNLENPQYGGPHEVDFE